MLAKTLILFLIYITVALAKPKVTVVGDRLNQTEHPQDVKNLKTTKEFIKLVDEHNLNVSLIISKATNHKNGNLKEVVTMTLTFPVNSKSLTETKLNHSHYDSFAKLANEEKLAVAGTEATNNQLEISTNSPKGIPVNKAYKIFTGIKNGKTGFVFDEENYVAQYSFTSLGEDGKNSTTKVCHGDIDVEVVGHKNFKDNELETIKKSLVDAYFTYEEELVPRAIFADLSKKLPDYNLEVAGNVGENSYLDSETWAHLKILEENYLIYV